MTTNETEPGKVTTITMLVAPPRPRVPDSVILAESRARRDSKGTSPATHRLLEAAWSLPPQCRRWMVKLALEAVIEARAEGLEQASSMTQNTREEESMLFMADATRQQQAFRGDYVEPMPTPAHA